jgi:hypothetical protein
MVTVGPSLIRAIAVEGSTIAFSKVITKKANLEHQVGFLVANGAEGFSVSGTKAYLGDPLPLIFEQFFRFLGIIRVCS